MHLLALPERRVRAAQDHEGVLQGVDVEEQLLVGSQEKHGERVSSRRSRHYIEYDAYGL